MPRSGNNPMPNMNGMMAPNFYGQMLEQGNQMLQNQGLQPYQPMQSPYFSNDFAQQHPRLSGALGGILGVLSNMGDTPPVSGFGAGLSRLAQGLAGNAMMQRQFAQQQAMLPMQIAQNVAAYRKTMAPEAITTPAGIALRNPMTGEITPGIGMAQIASGNNGAFDTGNADYAKNLLARLPDADEREQQMIKSSAQSFAQIWDPQKRAEAEAGLFKDIADKRLSHAQFEQTYAATQAQRQQMNAIQRENADSKRMIAGALTGKFDLAKAEFADKLYDPAKTADERMAIMQDAALHPNAQNDVALLFNHIGMTLSAQRGARISNAEIERAVTTRSIPQAILADIQKTGLAPDAVYQMLSQDPNKLPPGGFLSPQQRSQMLELAGTVRNVAWANARRSAAAAGLSNYEPSQLEGLEPVISNNSAGQRIDGGGRGINNPNPLIPPGMGANNPYAKFKRK